MFAVLSPVPYNAKDKSGRKMPKINVEQKIAGKGCYFIIYARKKRSGRLNYKKIKRAACEFASELIMPLSLSLPPESGLGRYRTGRFYKRVLLNTFICEADRFRHDIVGVIDKYGEFANELLPLLRKVKMVYILTDCMEAYDYLQNESERSLGCVPVFCSSQSEMAACKALLVLNFEGSFLAGGSNTAVFGNVPGGAMFHADEVELPTQFTDDICSDIDCLALGSALFERLQIGMLSKVKAKRFYTQ